ncbi:MAG: zinc-dependent metalloprotease family protein, partial [Phycisphaerales bacterium]
DPYTATDAGTFLDQFRTEWNNNQGSVQRDVAHLFTGKNLSGGTIGIAWLGVVCDNYGYGLVESDCCGSFGCTTDLSAHELKVLLIIRCIHLFNVQTHL